MRSGPDPGGSVWETSRSERTPRKLPTDCGTQYAALIDGMSRLKWIYFNLDKSANFRHTGTFDSGYPCVGVLVFVRRDVGMMRQMAWDRYEIWNEAFSHVVFTADKAGRPVYLDMDEDVLQTVATEAGVDPSRAVDELVAAVRGTLNLDISAGPVFAQHTKRLGAWRRRLRTDRDEDGRQAPPVLALLAVLTLAAEAMCRDSDHAANAYYPRLRGLLHVDDPRQARRLETAYRREAENLWRGLSEWLSAADGRFGLPSAYALSHRYVGLPISQALVRAADRQRFLQMFSTFGLPPGAEVSPADMERLLDDWIQQRPSPVGKNLESLWQRGQAHERIATVATIELLNWDGSTGEQEDSDGHLDGEVMLFCRLRRFPRPRFEVSFVADFRRLPHPRSLIVLSAESEPTIDVVPVSGARVQPAQASELDPASLVEGVLNLADPAESGRKASRRPRCVVPLRHDQFLNAYVECERVQLGEDAMLLVKDDRNLPKAVRETLQLIARPGFREETALTGLPTGWTLYTDVQIMTSPDTDPGRSDLNALVPILSSQLTLAGGLKLPGRMRKWSSLDPPEVRAVVQDANSITVRMTPLYDGDGPMTRPTAWTSEDPTLVVDLAEQKLPDGDYELSLVARNKIVQQTTLRLRSSNTPDRLSWQTAPRLVHDFDNDPLAVLRAASAPEPGAKTAVCGPYATPLHRMPSAQTGVSPGNIWWDSPKPRAGPPPAPIAIALPDPTSCVVTGAHWIKLPTFYGRPTSATVSGTCERCGLVKRFPARYSARRFAEWSGRRPKQNSKLTVDVSHLPEIKQRRANWDAAFDSLVHVGGGAYALLERVALQVEGTSLFVDDFTRGLEVRGDLEIQRAADLTPEAWEVSPAYLAEVTNGTYALTGSWTQHARHALKEQVFNAGGSVYAAPGGLGRTCHIVNGVNPDQLETIAASVDSAGEVRHAATRLLDLLPPLSEIEAALPRIPLPGARRILKFHVPSASWVPVASAAAPGAYRLEAAFLTTDIFRTAKDVDCGDAALGTVQLTKHIAAGHHGRPLLAYLESERALAVPLGADLPVLYGRAAVLCSGRLPTPVRQKRLLVYHDVPQFVADRLTHLLSS